MFVASVCVTCTICVGSTCDPVTFVLCTVAVGSNFYVGEGGMTGW